MSQIEPGNMIRSALDHMLGTGSTDAVLRALGLDGLLAAPSPIARFGTQAGSSYTVKRGDTLDGIARQHGTTWQTLARINGISDPNRIAPGQEIRLPTGRSAVHTVRSGDTLSGIAERYGTTVQALQRANPDIRDIHRIAPGQTIRLSGVGTSRTDGTQGTRTNGSGVVSAGQGRLNLDTFLDASRGSQSMAAIVIGNAEGTRTPSGGTTRAYGGHIDPGNAAANRGSFSLQNAGAVTPNRADQIQLGRLAALRPGYEAAARAAGLDPNDATLATAYFDLHNQSPSAARRFLSQIGTLASTGVTPQSVADLRFHSFVDRTTGRRFEGAGGGFANIARNNLGRAPSEAEVQQVIRADQNRRTTAMHRAMTEQGLVGAAPAPRPTPRPVTTEGAAVAARFPANRGIDLSPATVRNANALHDAVRAETGYSIHVTSGRRGPARQAAAMYDNYADGTPPTYRNRAAEGEVRAAYLEGRRNGWSRARTVESMTAVLAAQVDRGVYLSRHMRDGSIDIRTPPQHVINAIRDNPNVRSVLVENDHIHIDFR